MVMSIEDSTPVSNYTISVWRIIDRINHTRNDDTTSFDIILSPDEINTIINAINIYRDNANDTTNSDLPFLYKAIATFLPLKRNFFQLVVPTPQHSILTNYARRTWPLNSRGGTKNARRKTKKSRKTKKTRKHKKRTYGKK